MSSTHLASSTSPWKDRAKRWRWNISWRISLSSTWKSPNDSRSGFLALRACNKWQTLRFFFSHLVFFCSTATEMTKFYCRGKWWHLENEKRSCDRLTPQIASNLILKYIYLQFFFIAEVLFHHSTCVSMPVHHACVCTCVCVHMHSYSCLSTTIS